MRTDMRLNIKSSLHYVLIFFTLALLNSCSALKSCDCPGLESKNTTQTTQHS